MRYEVPQLELDPEDEQDPSVQAAVAYWQSLSVLLGVCDGAQTLDGQGFSGPDATPARRLVWADPRSWEPKQIEQAYAILGHYRYTQLPEYGIDYERLPVYKQQPDERERYRKRQERYERQQRTIEARGSLLLVRFPKRGELVEAMRSLPGYRRFRYGEGQEQPYWEVEPSSSNLPVLRSLVADWGFIPDEGAAALLAAPAAAAVADRRVEREGQGVALYFPYVYEIKEAVKALGFAFRDTPSKRWVGAITPRSAAPLAGILAQFGFSVPEDLVAELQGVADGAAHRELASRSATATVPELDGYRSRRGFTPYPFQVAGVRYLLDAKRSFLADVMGLGKTVQALLTLYVTGAYPAAILCPASVKLNWAREAREWLPEGTVVQVLNGSRTELDPAATVYVCNYDIAKHYVSQLNARGLRFLVLDESHYCKSPTAQRTLAATALAYGLPYEEVKAAAKGGKYDTDKGVEYRILMSGTPLSNRPIELVPQLRILGRFRSLFGSWGKYARTYCNAYYNGYGWDVSGANKEALPELNRTLRQSCYIRRDEQEARLELPDLVTAGVLLPIDNRAEYRRAAADIVSYAARIAKERAKADAELRGLDPATAAYEVAKAERDARVRTANAEQLALMVRLRSLLATGKIPAAIAWVGDWLEAAEDRKLVLFIHHKEAQQRLLEALVARGEQEGYKVAHILGSDTSPVRQEQIDAFQKDPAVRVIVCSLMAAREGITLTAAYTVAFLELDWVPGTHIQAERRVLRIGQEHTCWAYYLLAEDTTDEVLSEVLDEKRAIVGAAADGRVSEDTAKASMARLLAYLAQQEGRELPEIQIDQLPDEDEDEQYYPQPLEAAAERQTVGAW